MRGRTGQTWPGAIDTVSGEAEATEGTLGHRSRGSPRTRHAPGRRAPAGPRPSSLAFPLAARLPLSETLPPRRKPGGWARQTTNGRDNPRRQCVWQTCGQYLRHLSRLRVDELVARHDRDLTRPRCHRPQTVIAAVSDELALRAPRRRSRLAHLLVEPLRQREVWLASP